MPKMKTRKTAAKRFKVTGSGKLMYDHANLNHLMIHKKNGGRVRRMNQEGEVTEGEKKKILRMLPGVR
jgi:large subunit ribosomal protein L35